MTTQRAKDTPAWIFQSWAAFGISIAVAVWGIWSLNVEGFVRGFLALTTFGLMNSTFTLSKTVRDNQEQKIDNSAWIMQTWGAFAVFFVSLGFGVVWLPVDQNGKAFVAVGALFLVASTFTLAKTVRDNHEAERAVPPSTTPG